MALWNPSNDWNLLNIPSKIITPIVPNHSLTRYYKPNLKQLKTDCLTVNSSKMKKWLLSLLSLWIVNAGFAQAWAKQYDHVDECTCGLSLVGKGNKHGFVDKNGKVVVPLIYDEALTFSDGLAAVMQNNKWGYLDSTGKMVVELQYSEAMSFHNGMAVVVKGGNYGFINEKGTVVIPFEFGGARGFSADGLAPVMNAKGKWGYIDKKGKVVIPFKYGFADEFVDGVARVMEGSEMIHIDVSGKKVAEN